MFNEAILPSRAGARTQCALKLDGPRIAILLSTYNGEKYLAEQLDSIRAQTYDNWIIVASDDGSADSTVEILQNYRGLFGEDRLLVFNGPGKGFAANFLSLVCNPSINADLFAFCDQDDVWHADRLDRARQWLEAVPAMQPALHCGRTRIINSCGLYLGESPLFRKKPSFANSLVQSLAGGNTMILNSAAREVLAQAGNLSVVSHDWWTYMLITGSGGVVKYDEKPSIDYRQHDANIIGANSRVSDRIYRLRRMFAGHFQVWNDINIEALCHSRHLLAERHRETLDLFATARKARLLPRCKGVLTSGVHRQTVFGDLGLAAATLMGKI